jgi:hypothetical protein
MGLRVKGPAHPWGGGQGAVFRRKQYGSLQIGDGGGCKHGPGLVLEALRLLRGRMGGSRMVVGARCNELGDIAVGSSASQMDLAQAEQEGIELQLLQLLQAEAEQ